MKSTFNGVTEVVTLFIETLQALTVMLNLLGVIIA